MKRENIVGRANVEDTPELEKYYRELEGEALGLKVPEAVLTRAHKVIH